MAASLVLLLLPTLVPPPATRRAVLAASVLATSAPHRGRAATAPPPGFEVFAPGGGAPGGRVQGIGQGADMLSKDGPAAADVLYPPSLIGVWRCERAVTSVEGDGQQAEGAWRLLGGYGELRRPESYLVRYAPQPGAEFGEDGKMQGKMQGSAAGASARAITGTDGRRYFGVVLDRAFEMDARVHGARVRWEAAALPCILPCILPSSPNSAPGCGA